MGRELSLASELSHNQPSTNFSLIALDSTEGHFFVWSPQTEVGAPQNWAQGQNEDPPSGEGVQGSPIISAPPFPRAQWGQVTPGKE